MEKSRCGWCEGDPVYEQYHDNEWGTPLYDDDRLFEFLLLEGAQAGLSWITILRKRDNYAKAMSGFNARKIARYTDRDVERLMANEGIIRNRLKINAMIGNARAYLELKSSDAGFSDALWAFVDGAPVQHRYRRASQVPAQTPESLAMSKMLKKRGFSFVGPTICYAFMQATGMVNDHLLSCYRHEECGQHAL